MLHMRFGLQVAIHREHYPSGDSDFLNIFSCMGIVENLARKTRFLENRLAH